MTLNFPGSGGSGLLEEACKLLLDAGKFAAEFIQKNNIRRHPLQLEIAHNLHQAQVLLQRYSPTTQGSPSEPSVWESMRIIDEDFVKTRTADQLRKLPCFMLEGVFVCEREASFPPWCMTLALCGHIFSFLGGQVQ